MKKRIVAALMASVMCLSMLAGCGNNDDSTSSGSGAGTSGSGTTGSSTPSSTSGNTESTSGSSEADPAADANAFEQTWPDGQKITWMVRDDNATANYTRYYDLIAIQRIEEMFHVDIEFIPFNGKAEDAGTQYLAMMADEQNRPDVVGYMHNDAYKEKGGISGLYQDGVCIELNDLIDTKIPNLKKIFEEHPDIAKDMSDADGRYLYLQRINPYASERDFISSTTTGLVMRKDWLDAVGMDVPTNMDEWTEVLTAFKTMDPNGNNQTDEVPFNAYSSGIMLFEAAYGMSSGIYIDPDTGKVEHGARTQKYKDYLTKMNEWYTDGLMDRVFDENGNAVKDGDDLITGGIAGSWKGLSNNDTKFAEAMRTDGGQPDTEFVAVPWPATADGTVYSQRGVSRLQKNTVIVTTNCAQDPKKLDAVAAIFNYMLSEEGSLLLTWGEEGVTFTTDDHGVRSLTEYGNEQIELKEGTSKPQQYKMYGNQSDCLVSYGNFDVDSATRDEWYNESATIWAGGSFELSYPASITLTAEQTKKIGDSQLSTYIAEMKWKFITGQEPLANYDAYLAELDRLGIADMVAVYQEAYDAYMAK